MNDLTHLTFGIYLQGRLIRGAEVGSMSYDEADALQAQLERDYPGCVIALGEF